MRGNTKREKYRRIMDRKVGTSVEDLCQGFPNEFVTYINYSRGLRFEERPDYSYLKRLFKELFFRHNFQYDFLYDWVVLKESGGKARAEEEKKEARRTEKYTQPKIVTSPF